MPNGINPSMPPGVNIFREIGISDAPQGGERESETSDVDEIIAALRGGQTKDIIRAKDMLERVVRKRTERPDQPDMPPAPSPAEAIANQAKRPGPVSPQQAPGGPQQAPGGPQQAPAGPSAPQGTPPKPQGSPQAQGNANVLSDLVKLINAASKTVSGPSTMTGQAQAPANPLTQNAMPGRKPM